MITSSHEYAPCSSDSICEVTGWMGVPYIVWACSAPGMKLARPKASITRKGTLANTPRRSNASIAENWRSVVARPNVGASRGTGTRRSRGTGGAALAWRRLNVAASSASATLVHSTRLANR